MKYRIAASLCLTAACAASIASPPAFAQLSANAKVYASGLEGPRGLKFGPDGTLYVAEAGTGGTTATTPGQCAQVIPPVGPYTNGNTSRISKVSTSGKLTTVASGFPSAVDAMGDFQGVADVAFLDGKLYAVLAGGGCSHGSAVIPNAIVHVNTTTGAWQVVADLSDFLMTHPVAYPNLGDFEPDGTFYSLISVGDRLYTVEPNHGQVISMGENGLLREDVDVSKAEGHIVPTSIAEKDGRFYVGNLGVFPITPNASKVLTLTTADCFWPYVVGLGCSDSLTKLRVSGSRAGFTTIVAVDFGPDGLLYVLELSPLAGYPTGGVGKVVRLNRAGVIEDIATGFTVPTGMTFGPDGRLYVSNLGAAPPGAGQIVRVTIP